MVVYYEHINCEKFYGANIAITPGLIGIIWNSGHLENCCDIIDFPVSSYWLCQPHLTLWSQDISVWSFLNRAQVLH